MQPHRELSRVSLLHINKSRKPSSPFDHLVEKPGVDQQQQLLSRLVSNDPTKKHRDMRAKYAVTTNNNATKLAAQNQSLVSLPHTEAGNDVVVSASRAIPATCNQPRRPSYEPITIEDFTSAYTKDDPMLAYMLHVIVHSQSVRRAEMPKGKDAIRKNLPSEQDVLFLVYHPHPPCGFRNIYWLSFIHEDKVLDTTEKEYFTLSSHGLTHMCQGAVIEFHDVESWIHEKRAFDHMTMMRGLQLIQLLLSFMSWKKKAIRLRHRRVRAELACRLLLCDPIVAPLLARIRTCCVMIEEDGEKLLLPTDTSLSIKQLTLITRTRTKHAHKLFQQQARSIGEIIEGQVLLLPPKRSGMEGNSSRSGKSDETILHERLYTVLRLADMQYFEALTINLKHFVSQLHDMICGPSLSTNTSSAVSFSSDSDNEVKHQALHQVEDEPSQTLKYSRLFVLRSRAPPFPFLYAQVIDFINNLMGLDETAIAALTMEMTPTRNEVLECIYNALNGYIAAIDETPRILVDTRFAKVLTPFAPEFKSTFLSTLLRPSTLVMQECAAGLKAIRHAIDVYYRQVHLILSHHIMRVRQVKEAEAHEVQLKETNRLSSTLSLSLLNATQYEQAQCTWNGFLNDIQRTCPIVQIGIFLMDQTPFVLKMHTHISTHITNMIQQLPNVYQQFLCDLLQDVSGRIDHVTIIPTSVSDALVWLTHVMEMMPSHPFRQAFDMKCMNLLKLKEIVKDCGIIFREKEEFSEIKRMDMEWESTYETLMTCLVRVQEPESEHRSSIYELKDKTDVYVKRMLEIIQTSFRQLPSYEEESSLVTRKAKDLAEKKAELVGQLEQLVEIERDCEEMLEHCAVFEREHGEMCGEESMFATTSISMERKTKLASEMLLDHISTMIELYTWYGTWMKLERQWLHTPVAKVHPGIVQSRIKQFQRRLLHSSSKLIPSTYRNPFMNQIAEFIAPDMTMVAHFQDKVDRMKQDYYIFQAIASDAFTAERWRIVAQLMGIDHRSTAGLDPHQITLQMLKEHWKTSPDQLPRFQDLCDTTLLESRLHHVMEQVQHRLEACQVVVHTNTIDYRVTLINLPRVVEDLHDLVMDCTLHLHAQSPEYDQWNSLTKEIQLKLSLCTQMMLFIRQYDLLCDLSRVHDVDEFFTGGVGSLGKVKLKKHVNTDETKWAEFMETNELWNERLRRLPAMSGKSEKTSVIIEIGCRLNDLVDAFVGFDFTLHVRRCEVASVLFTKYLADLREKTVRFYLLSDAQLLRLLTNEDDVSIVQKMLTICFPHISHFEISRKEKHKDENETSSRRRTSKVSTNNDVVISGFTCTGLSSSVEFNVPVLKIGRVNFWFARVEEEMMRVVMDNVKQAVSRMMRRDESISCDTLFPQSLLVASTLLLTRGVERCFTLQLSPPARVERLKSVQCQFDRMAKQWIDMLCDPTKGVLGSNNTRIETALLVVRYHREILQYLLDLFLRDQGDPTAVETYWNTQIKMGFTVEDLSSKSGRRLEDGDVEQWEKICNLGPGFPITFVTTVAHMDFTVRHEFVGMGRVPVLSPLTQRCVFALFRAIRAQRGVLASVAPYSSGRGGGVTTLLTGIQQVLMKSMVWVECTHGTITHHQIDCWLRYAKAMDAFIIFRHATALGTPILNMLQGMIQHVTSQETSAHGGTSLSAVVVPLYRSELSSTNVLMSVSESFHPVAVVLPSITTFVEALALVAGFSSDQCVVLKGLNAFFESLVRILSQVPSKLRVLPYGLISRIMANVSRYRATRRVILPSTELSAKLQSRLIGPNRRRQPPLALFQRTIEGQSTRKDVIDTIFYHAVMDNLQAYLVISSESIRSQLIELVIQSFPQGKGCQLTEKPCDFKDDVLLDTLEMCLDHNGLAVDTPILLQKCVELYGALETRRCVLLVGHVGFGKSTCIKLLDQALNILDMADEGKAEAHHPSELVILNPQVIGFEDVPYSSIQSVLDQLIDQQKENRRHWFLVDGTLSGTWPDAIVQESHTIPHTRLGPHIPRFLFEAVELLDISPTFLTECQVITMPRSVTQEHLISSWQKTWSSKLQLTDEQVPENFNILLVFRLVQTFFHGPVVRFIEEVHKEKSCCLEDRQIGVVSVMHGTKHCLNLLSSLLLHHPTQLQDQTPLQVAHLVVFGFVWGFAGHLSEVHKRHLDQSLRDELKTILDLKQKSGQEETNESSSPLLYESERYRSYWNLIGLPLERLSSSTTFFPDTSRENVSLYNPRTHHYVILSNGSISIARIARLWIQSSQSFMFTGTRGCGKTSLLEWLYLMHEEDKRRETLIDASIDAHRRGSVRPHLLNWLYKPPVWFMPRTNAQDQFCRSTDEAALFSLRHSTNAATMVFLDDLGMPSNVSDQASSIRDAFVRMIVDHHVGYNWHTHRVVPVQKYIGTSMCLTSSSSLSSSHARLLRHFSILAVSSYDRKQLLGIFRQKYSSSFPDTGLEGGDQDLSLQEILLRATIDVAVEILMIQQQNEDGTFVKGFTFNLHDVNAILKRSLDFTRSLTRLNGQQDRGSALLMIGKAHHCWMSEVRHVFLTTCETTPVEDEIPFDQEYDTSSLSMGETLQRVAQYLRAASEKYFTMTSSDDTRRQTIREIVYYGYWYLVSRPDCLDTTQQRLDELLSSCASATNVAKSTGPVRRKALQLSKACQATTQTTREEIAVHTIRDMILACFDHSTKGSSLDDLEVSRLKLGLDLSTTTSMYTLMYLVHVLGQRCHLVIPWRTRVIVKRLLHSAFQLHEIHLVDLSAEGVISISDQLEKLFIEVLTTRDQKVVLSIDLSQKHKDQMMIHQLLFAMCSGHVPPILMSSQRLREQMIKSCLVHNRGKLCVLTEEDSIQFLCEQVRQSVRLCVFVGDEDSHITNLLRESNGFQWYTCDTVGEEEEEDRERQLSDRTSHAIQKMGLSENKELMSLILKVDRVLSQPIIHSAEEFLSLLTNMITHTEENQIGEVWKQREVLLRLLEDIKLRIPLLQKWSENLDSEILQQNSLQQIAWKHMERAKEYQDQQLQALLDDPEIHVVSVASVEGTIEVPLHNSAAQDRMIQKWEHDVWALRAIAEESALRTCECQVRKEAIEAEIEEWNAIQNVREYVYELYRTEHSTLDQVFRSVEQRQTFLTCRSLMASIEMTYNGVPGFFSERSRLLKQLEPQSQIPFLDQRQQLVFHLWHARFPFLSIERQCRQLWAADQVRDRIPVLMDPTGLVQSILVPLFTNTISFFGDHMDGKHMNGGEVGMVVHCDDREKMWRKLREAMDKNLPTLLLGLRGNDHALLEAIGHYASRKRTPKLCTMTLQAYELERKRQQKRSSGSTKNASLVHSAALLAQRKHSSISPTVGTTHSNVPNKAASLAHALLASHKATGREAAHSPPQRTDSLDSIRRNLLELGSGSGFQIYAITSFPIHPNSQSRHGASYAFLSVEYDDEDLETYFTEVWMRKRHHPVYREFIQVRQAQVENDFQWIQVETALWSLVNESLSIATLSSEQRSRLVRELVAVYSVREQHMTQAPILTERHSTLEQRRLELLELDGSSHIGQSFNQLAQCCIRFAFILPTMIYARTFRFFEHVIESSISERHQQDIVSELQHDTVSSTASIFQLVLNDAVDEYLAGIISSSHQSVFRILFMIAQLLESNKATVETWFIGAGAGGHWLRQYQTSLSTSASFNNLGAIDGNSLSTAERLRSKLRQCSLLYDQFSSKTNCDSSSTKETTPHKHSSLPSPIRPETDLKSGRQDLTGLTSHLQELQNIVNTVGRSVKTLWCEWRIAQEDQRHELVCMLATIRPNTSRQASSRLTLLSRSRRGTGPVRRSHSLQDNVNRINRIKMRTLSDLLDLLGITTSYQPSFEQWLMHLMVVRVWCPLLFAQELNTFMNMHNSMKHATTRDILGLSATSLIPRPLVPFMDLAWRHDDLIHLPTRVLVYDPRERAQIELFILQAKASSHKPLYILTIYSFVENNSSHLRNELTTLITSKNRFMIEVLNNDVMERVITLVSQLINQHALLCIPEWFILCCVDVWSVSHSEKTRFFRVHIVSEQREDEEFEKQLSQWLDTTVGSMHHGQHSYTGQENISHLAQSILHCYDNGEDQGSFPFVTHLDECLTLYQNVRKVTNKRSSSVLSMLDDNSPSKPRQTKGSAIQSLEVLGDFIQLGIALENSFCTRLPLPNSLIQSLNQLRIATDSLQQVIQLLEISDKAHNEINLFPWWPIELEYQGLFTTLVKFNALFQQLQTSTTSTLSHAEQRDYALVSSGIMPIAWLEQILPQIHSNTFMTSLVSVPQVLVLLVSRLMFITHVLLNPKTLSTFSLSLLWDPAKMFQSLRRAYADVTQSDDVLFVLEVAIEGVNIEGHGIQVDGLRMLERVADGNRSCFMHVLPPCNLSCRLKSDVMNQSPIRFIQLASYSRNQNLVERNDSSQEEDTTILKEVYLGQSLEHYITKDEEMTRELVVTMSLFPIDDEEQE